MESRQKSNSILDEVVAAIRSRGGGGKPASYYRRANTPKSQRDRVHVRPAPALVDCTATLGHAPRPRKRVKR